MNTPINTVTITRAEYALLKERVESSDYLRRLITRQEKQHEQELTRLRKELANMQTMLWVLLIGFISVVIVMGEHFIQSH